VHAPDSVDVLVTDTGLSLPLAAGAGAETRDLAC